MNRFILKHTICIWGIMSCIYACDGTESNTDMMSTSMAGELAGTVSGNGAGEVAGAQAGEVAGEVAGEQAGGVAGEAAGEMVLSCTSNEECPMSERCIDQQCMILDTQEVDFCRLQFPLEISVEMNEEVSYFARLYQMGFTDISSQTDPSEFVLAQVGVGRVESLPDDSWIWFDAQSNPQYDAATLSDEEVDQDEYMATISIIDAGIYNVAARFSVDAGLTWTVCDSGIDGAGNTDGYASEDAGLLTVWQACELGFIRDDEGNCVDLDECQDNNGGCDANANCTNQIGQAPLCVCSDGYQGNGVNCEDIDECQDNNGGCDLNARCDNQVAQAPLCVCNDGYQGNGLIGAELVCTDIDECQNNNGECDANARCENQIGQAPLCVCNDGYQGSGVICEDIDECQDNNGGCDASARCDNQVAQDPLCFCDNGYQGNGLIGTELICTDIDECQNNNGECDANARCENQIGQAPLCVCNDGYQGNGLVCEDINECQNNNGGCHPNALCENQLGQDPLCVCNDGYQGNGLVCEDINECQDNNGECDANARCENQIGQAPLCVCNDGYQGSGVVCEDINECQNNNGGCHPNALCENQLGQDPLCVCNDGYQGNGLVCEDINECQDNNGECDANARCENQIGQAPLCVCNDGYQGNGRVCEDINECQDNNGECHPNALCENQLGQDPLCVCNDGYQGNGRICNDIDECQDNNGGCDENARCENQIGDAPLCICNEGFIGDGLTCVIPPPLTLDEIQVGDLVISEVMANPIGISDSQGEWFEMYNRLDRRIDLTGLVVRDASLREFTLSTALLVDAQQQDMIMEARSYLLLVRVGDPNENGQLNARFDYDNSFALNNSSETLWLLYQDVILDEISYGSSFNGASLSFDGAREPNTVDNDDLEFFCPAISLYTNDPQDNFGTPGAPNDVCPPCEPGFELNVNDDCVDINECLDNNGGCDPNANCSNQVADDPICDCKIGYEGNGETCEDIDECQDNNGNCDPNAACTNQIGQAPICNCTNGYSGNGSQCTNVNECLTNNGGCEQNCIDEIGTYRCECNSGYILNANGNRCDDVNECLDNNGGCDSTATCENQVGADPICTCPVNSVGDGITCRAIDPNSVNFCRLQFPAQANLDTESSITVYGRLYEPGITDQSAATDETEEVRGEVGYGPVGSDPYDVLGRWVWQSARNNVGYNGNSDSINEDEYEADLTVDQPGNYDYAFRFTVDAGQSWTVCDLDGSGDFDPAPSFGYSSDQAGDLQVICANGDEEVVGAGCVTPLTTVAAQNLINGRCSGCHSNTSWISNFPNQAINSLAVNNFDYIEPGDYMNSYLWIKIAGDPRMFGNQMPRGNALPQSTIDAFAAWIQSL